MLVLTFINGGQNHLIAYKQESVNNNSLPVAFHKKSAPGELTLTKIENTVYDFVHIGSTILKRSYTLISSLLLLAWMACTPENNTPAISIPNTLPQVYLVSDLIGYPFPNIRIEGNVTDGEDNIKSMKWTQLSGPSGALIVNKFSPTTLIKDLKNGTYIFELEALDDGGFTGSEEISIGVEIDPMEDGDLIIKKLPWLDPWDFPRLDIQQFRLNVPKDKIFKVYIQRDNDTKWIEVPQGPLATIGMYEYFIDEKVDSIGKYPYGSLLLTTTTHNLSDSPNVKIVFQP